jgi:hypothetical protein
MGRSKTSTWVGGTVVVALLLLVAGWFLLVSPVLASASETRAATEDVQADNDVTRARIETLKAQFETLDQSKADLAALQLQIPTTGQLSDYLRQVDEQAAARTVAVTSVSPSSPELFAPVTGAAPAATTTDAAGTDGTVTDTSGDTATTPAPAAGSTAPVGMVDVPVTLTAVGSYANVMSWIQALQEQTDRLLLVTTVTGTAQDDQPAGGGKPQTVKGDIEVSVTGYLYVLPNDKSIPVVTPEETEATLPGADPNRNPLLG